jgi:hypothetical protein
VNYVSPVLVITAQPFAVKPAIAHAGKWAKVRAFCRGMTFNSRECNIGFLAGQVNKHSQKMLGNDFDGCE